MLNPSNIEKFNAFEEKIKYFLKNPTKYKFSIKNRLLRQARNSFLSFIIWFLITLFINLLGLIYFINTNNHSDSSSLLAILALFFTVAARNYTVNHFMFSIIGNNTKDYLLHELTNKIGFFHRFMAFSTLIWLSVHYINTPKSSNGLAIILICLLIVIIFSAFAIFRRKKHNTFENTHRYLGYTSMILLLIYYFQINLQNKLAFIDISLKPHFFILLAIIIMLVSPWIGVKKVAPKLVHVAPHVIGVNIEGKPSFGTYSKITLGNGYYHPFGDSMLDFEDMQNRTLYLTPAGDRTSQIVNNANKGNFLLEKCTIKKQRNKGFMYHHSIYKHILIIVTGGGIAPIIPCLVLNKKTKIDVVWIGKSQSTEFTSEFIEKLIKKVSKQEIGIHIIDTTKKGLKSFTNEHYVALALKAYKHYNPEAVFVMSNQNLTIDMLYAYKQNNIKAYGATFDS